MAKLTAAATGTTTAARTARRSPSYSGSRSRTRSTARRRRPVGGLVIRGNGGESPVVQCVGELFGDPRQRRGVAREGGLLVADKEVDGPPREHLGLPVVLQDLPRRAVHDV